MRIASFVLLIAASLVFAIHAYHLPAASSQTLASWVQAVGSCLAIYTAYLVGARQSEAGLISVREAQRAATDALRAGHLAVVQAALTHAQEIKGAMTGDTPASELYRTYDKRITQRISKDPEKIPHEVNNEAGVRSILSMPGQFLLLEQALGTSLSGPWKIPGLKEVLGSYPWPDERAKRTAFYDYSLGILAKNVLNHIERIEKGHEAVVVASRDLGSTRSRARHETTVLKSLIESASIKRTSYDRTSPRVRSFQRYGRRCSGDSGTDSF
ncbi:hypothetical protein SAMN02800694_2618 [Luteibacter sp. UNCMF331Sha3.1]|uniref:hypothetical protein n=1 Tax=Luteibacter sp. UNCMF331Sha3.1 TaxID=1502760 RepID=UPI0008D6A3E3|nr:hypothetical protein [Luteibacter sp. UNCMF331Sha3.1]SEN05275.1 hypothetical protein SAMN02800694_2618 [Luteibacter sp. UNCMF331Sha3.1]